MLTPGPRTLATLAAVLLAAGLTSAMTSATSLPADTMVMAASLTPDPGISACAGSPCLNGGTCRETEDWECSGDPGLGHVSCHCPRDTTGPRCEVRLNTTGCQRDGQTCGANGTCLCRKDNDCNCMPDFPYSPPNCSNETVLVNFDLKSWSPQPIICFEMYYTNASSLCYDPDDTLVFSVTSEQTADLFCLTVNYNHWRTCLQVNNTFRTKLQSVRSSEKVTLTATEYRESGEKGRSDSLQVEVVFNRAPLAANSTHVLNSAELAKPRTIDLVRDARIQDPDGHNMTFEIDSSNKPSHIVLNLSSTKGTLQVSAGEQNTSEFLITVTVKVVDDGIPSLSTSFNVSLRLLYLDCLRPASLYLDTRLLPATAPGPLVFREHCLATPGYATSLRVEYIRTASVELNVSHQRGSLHILSGSTDVHNLTLSVILGGSINQTWVSKLYIGFFKTISFAVTRPLWNEQLSDPFSDLFRNQTSLISTEVASVLRAQPAYFDVVQFRRDGGVRIDSLVYALTDTALQEAADKVLQFLRSNSTSTFSVDNSTVRMYDQVGFLNVRELTPETDQLHPGFPVNNTKFKVTCHVEAMTLDDEVTVNWKLNGFPVRPMETSRFQIENTSSVTTTHRSVLKASPVFHRDRGNVTCEARTRTTGVVSARNLELQVMTPPRVTLEPSGTSYVREGQQLNVTCSVTSYPAPSHTQLQNDMGNILAVKVNATKLTYSYTPTAKRTILTCTANNTVGQSEGNRITLIVFSAPGSSGVTTCPPARDRRGVVWREVPANATASQPCPDNYTGLATRQCLENSSFAAADYSQCVRTAFVDLEKQVEQLQDGIMVTSLLEVSQVVTSLTARGQVEVTEAELDQVVTLMTRLSSLSSDFALSQEAASNTTHEFLKIANNVMVPENKRQWQQLKESKNKTAVGLMLSVDTMSETLAQTLQNASINISEGFLALLVGNKHMSDLGNISFPDSARDSSSLLILRDTIESLPSPENNLVKYSALKYSDVGSLLPGETSASVSNGTQPVINSEILVMNLFSHPNASASPLITLTFLHANASFTNPVCGFWNTTTQLWDNTGCRVTRRLAGATECQCDHLTNFALLMSPSAVTDHLALTVITYVGVGISLLCLVLTLAIYAAVWRYVRSDRASILVNLCVALTLAYVTFLAGVSRTDNKGVCTAVAVLLHYFFLAAFFLMLAEGLEVLVTMVTVFSTSAKRGKLLAVGWGVPLLVVGISMAATQLNGYGDAKSCWLSLGNGVFWAFVVPALFVIVANSCIIIKIIHTMLHTRSMVSKPLQTKARAALRSLCVLVPVLGVTWISGIMAVNEQTLAFQYIFTVCNSLQGLFIFIFHCALNNKVREGLGHSVRKFQSRRSMHTSHRSSKSPQPHANGDQSTPPRRDSGGSPYLLRPGITPLAKVIEGQPFRTIGTNGSDGSNQSSDREALHPSMFRPATRRQDELPARRSPLSARSVVFQDGENGRAHQPESGERRQRRYKSRHSPPAPRPGQPRRGSHVDPTRFADLPAPFSNAAFSNAAFSNAAFEEDEAPYMQRVAQRVLTPDFEPAVVFGSRGSDLHNAGRDGALGGNAVFGDSHRQYVWTTVVVGNPGNTREHQRFPRNTADPQFQTYDLGSGLHSRRTRSPHSTVDSRGRGPEADARNNHSRSNDDAGPYVTSIKLPRVTLR